MDTLSPIDGSQTVDAVIARIRAYMAAQNLRRGGLATRAKLQESSIRNIDKPEWNPTAETLRALTSVIPDDFRVSAEDVQRFAPPPSPADEETDGQASRAEEREQTGEAAAE